MIRIVCFFVFFNVLFPNTFQEGYNLFVRGNYLGAVEIFQDIWQKDPINYKNTLWLGKSFFNAGDQKNAIMYLIKAVKLNDNDTEAKDLLNKIEHVRTFNVKAEEYYHQGYFAYLKKDFNSAKDLYWNAILIDKTVPKYHLWHIRALIALGEKDKARAQLEYALKMKPRLNPLNVLSRNELKRIKADKEYYKFLVNLSNYHNKKKVSLVNDKKTVATNIAQEVKENAPHPKENKLDKELQNESNSLQKIIEINEYSTQVPTMSFEEKDLSVNYFNFGQQKIKFNYSFF
jgi:tetratricopeptide (TPR) repeat protein